MPHMVRTSERMERRRCLRSWDLRYRQGWVPIVHPQALEFGQAFHEGLRVVYDPKTWLTTTPREKLANAVEAFTWSCEEQRDRYLQATGQTRLSWNGQDDYASRVVLGTKMLEYYVLNVHPKEDTWFKPVKVEIPFELPLLDETGEPLRCNNSPRCGQVHEPNAVVNQTGRVDAIVEDIVGPGGYWLIDWKTVGGDRAIDGTEKRTARFSDPNLVWMHDQLASYCFALRYRRNIDVRGFVLAEIRKDYPRPPASLRRKRNGVSFSTDRSQATTYELFRDYVRVNDSEAYSDGLYNAYLRFLAGDEAPTFYKRFKTEKTIEELRQVGVSLAREVRSMLDQREIYPEPSERNCRLCLFKSPCGMMMRDMDHVPALRAGFEQVVG